MKGCIFEAIHLIASLTGCLLLLLLLNARLSSTAARWSRTDVLVQTCGDEGIIVELFPIAYKFHALILIFLEY